MPLHLQLVRHFLNQICILYTWQIFNLNYVSDNPSICCVLCLSVPYLVLWRAPLVLHPSMPTHLWPTCCDIFHPWPIIICIPSLQQSSINTVLISYFCSYTSLRVSSLPVPPFWLSSGHSSGKTHSIDDMNSARGKNSRLMIRSTHGINFLPSARWFSYTPSILLSPVHTRLQVTFMPISIPSFSPYSIQMAGQLEVILFLNTAVIRLRASGLRKSSTIQARKMIYFNTTKQGSYANYNASNTSTTLALRAASNAASASTLVLQRMSLELEMPRVSASARALIKHELDYHYWVWILTAPGRPQSPRRCPLHWRPHDSYGHCNGSR